MTTKSYNGHKNYNSWNVSLWINNDQSLYNIAIECIENNSTKEGAAENFLDILTMDNITHTPDGVKYSKSTIREAMVGM